MINASQQSAWADVTAVLAISSTQPEQALKTWTPQQLQSLKKASKSEKDPKTGKISVWEGPLLQDLIDKSLESIPLETKAQVDLIILKDSSGGEALIPRSFVTKYPVMLALKKDHQPLPTVHSVVPWTSQPKSMSEELPVERYFVVDVARVELGNYREKYRTAFLTRRTDPSAMKGEKIYVQSCLGCHSGSASQANVGSKARTVATSGSAHPAVSGLPKLDDRSKRALLNYLDELGNESGSRPQQAGSPGAQAAVLNSPPSN